MLSRLWLVSTVVSLPAAAMRRCAKRHNMMRSKQINYKVVAVFPGPTIAKNLRPFLYKTVAAFRHYGLRSEGLEVSTSQPPACAGSHASMMAIVQVVLPLAAQMITSGPLDGQS